MPWRQNKKPRSVCILIHFAASNAVMGMCLMCAGEPSVYALLATLANKRKWTTSEKEIAKSISVNKSIFDTFLLETKCWKCWIFWAGEVKKKICGFLLKLKSWHCFVKLLFCLNSLWHTFQLFFLDEKNGFIFIWKRSRSNHPFVWKVQFCSRKAVETILQLLQNQESFNNKIRRQNQRIKF